jgi:hypothetical protein
VIAKHFWRFRQQGIARQSEARMGSKPPGENIRVKAMIVTSSRLAVVQLCELLRKELATLEEQARKKAQKQQPEQQLKRRRRHRVSVEKRTCSEMYFGDTEGTASSAFTPLRVFGAFSGSVNISQRSHSGGDCGDGVYSITEAALNSASHQQAQREPRHISKADTVGGGDMDSDAITVTLENADLIVVCNKLETGYNDPNLCVMYVDRELRGARAVQVLSRLNRKYAHEHGESEEIELTNKSKKQTREAKKEVKTRKRERKVENHSADCIRKHTAVVDFANSAEAIREAFEEFAGETTWQDDELWQEQQKQSQLDRAITRLFYAVQAAVDSRALSGHLGAEIGDDDIMPSVDALVCPADMTVSQIADCLVKAPVGDREEAASALQRYIDLCEALGVEKSELPYRFACGIKSNLDQPSPDPTSPTGGDSIHRKGQSKYGPAAGSEERRTGEGGGDFDVGSFGALERIVSKLRVSVSGLQRTHRGEIVLASSSSLQPIAVSLQPRPLRGGARRSHSKGGSMGALSRKELKMSLRDLAAQESRVAAGSGSGEGKNAGSKQWKEEKRQAVLALVSMATEAWPPASPSFVGKSSAEQQHTSMPVDEGDTLQLQAVLHRLLMLQVEADTLKETSAGVLVAKLRKHPSPFVARLARLCLKRWKQAVKDEKGGEGNKNSSKGKQQATEHGSTGDELRNIVVGKLMQVLHKTVLEATASSAEAKLPGGLHPTADAVLLVARAIEHELFKKHTVGYLTRKDTRHQSSEGDTDTAVGSSPTDESDAALGTSAAPMAPQDAATLPKKAEDGAPPATTTPPAAAALPTSAIGAVPKTWAEFSESSAVSLMAVQKLKAEYRSHFRALLINLKDKRNGELRVKVCKGELTPARLATMSVSELANSELVAQRAEWADKRKAETILEAGGGSTGNTDRFECPQCQSRNCFMNNTGMRGAWISSQMEESVLVLCCACHFKWVPGAGE